MEIHSSSKKIRAISLGLIRNSKGQYLYHQGHDKIKNENFYRPLGGGIDFGEPGDVALKREMLEELNEDVTVKGLIMTFENIFTYEDRPSHEIVLVYQAEFNNKETYNKPTMTIQEHDGNSLAVWKTLEEIKSEKANLYPIGLEDLISTL